MITGIIYKAREEWEMFTQSVKKTVSCDTVPSLSIWKIFSVLSYLPKWQEKYADIIGLTKTLQCHSLLLLQCSHQETFLCKEGKRSSTQCGGKTQQSSNDGTQNDWTSVQPQKLQVWEIER